MVGFWLHGQVLGGTEAEPGQHLTVGERGAVCPGEVNAKLYHQLCGDCGGIFSLGDQLVRTRFPLSLVF